MIIGVIDYMINLTVIIRAFIGLIAAVATYYLIPLLKKKLGSEKLDEAVEWIKIAVQAAEMIWQNLPSSGEEKKNYVLEFLNSKGLTFDENEVDAMIESAVLELKNMDLENTDSTKSAVTIGFGSDD